MYRWINHCRITFQRFKRIHYKNTELYCENQLCVRNARLRYSSSAVTLLEHSVSSKLSCSYNQITIYRVHLQSSDHVRMLHSLKLAVVPVGMVVSWQPPKILWQIHGTTFQCYFVTVVTLMSPPPPPPPPPHPWCNLLSGS